MTLDNVAPGALTAASTQAVNGGQINTLGSSEAANLGGGSTFNPATGTVTAPTYNVAGTAYTNVGSAITALTGGSTTAGVKYFHANSTGPDSTATGADSIAVGSGTTATGQYAIAQGFGASAGSGTDMSFRSSGGIAIGAFALAGNNPGGTSLAIGDRASATSATGDAVAIGTNTTANAVDSIAIGAQTTASAVNTIAIGNNGTSNAGTNSVVIGIASTASNAASGSVVLGSNSSASAANETVLGRGASATTTGGVALGNGSMQLRGGLDGGAESFSGTAVASTNGAVSVGAAGAERQITNVAGGTQATDAVNVRQLTAVGTDLAGSLGGGAAFNPATGAYTAPAYTLNGTTYNNVGAALGGVANGAVGPVEYANAATPTTPNGGVPSQNLTLVGAAAGPVTLDNVAPGALTAASTQAVNGAQINTLGSSEATNLGGGSTFNPATGTVTAPTYNVAGGTQANVGAALGALVTATQTQGTGLAMALGGGAAVAPNGTVTAPAYTLNGTTYTNVGTALGGIANGAVGPVEYSNAATPTTPNGGVPSQNLTLVGAAAGPVTLDNVAPGALTAASTQAVNGGQINTLGSSVATNFGGGSTFDPATGTVTAPTYDVAGTAYNNVGSAIGALTGGSTTAGVKYFHANSTGADSSATGVDSVAIGSGAVATNAGDVALGQGSTTAAAVRTAGTTIAGTAYTFAGTNPTSTVSVGAPGAERTITNVAAGQVTATSTDAVNGSELYATNTALGSLASGGAGPVQYSNAATPTTPNGGMPSQNLTLVGAAAGPVTLDNVAPGALTAGSTQAVNGGQINTIGTSVATNLGGGSTFDPTTGTVTAPTYNVAGGTQTNVGAALGALDTATQTQGAGLATALGGGAAVAPNGTVTAPAYTLNGTTYTNVGAALGGVANGAVGPVEYANAATPTTPNGGVPSQNLTLVGAAAGPVTLDNVAPGALTAASTQAVNGGQINTLGSSEATNLGGGSTFNPATGTVTAPTYNVAGGTQANVGAALGALDTATQTQGAGLAMALGGGASVAPNGTVTAPAYTLNGTTYNNVGTALGGIANGAVGPVEYSNAATPTTPNGGVPSQNLTLVGAAAGPVTLDNVAPGALTAASTQAVNGGQINTLGSSVATNFGGGSTFDPATGTVTAPTYDVAGTAYNNVGSAIGALTGGSTTAGVKYFHANSTGADSSATGVDSVAIGSGAVATDAGDVALGQGSTTATAVRTAGTTIAGTAYTFAGTTPASTVSVGAPGAERTITNVAAGQVTATSTDAVNGSELYATNTALGSLASGGAGPVQYANAATPTTPDGGVPSQNLTLVGAAAGPVTLDNVAPGALTTGSTQAVNGGQINTIGTSVATNFGGGSTFDPTTGTVTAPTYNVAGGTQTNVGAALGALDAATQMQGLGLAMALGGGASVAPNGTVTAPAYTLNGTTYTNVGAALGGIANGAVGPVQYANAATPTTPNGGVPSQNLTLVGAAAGPVTLDNVAPGALTATSTQAVNGSQLYATNNNVAALTNGTAGLVQQTGGSPGNGAITIGLATGGATLDVSGTAGNRVVTGVQAGAVNVGSSDAVNGSQLYASSASVAAALGGGSGVAANGTVTAPSYTVQGGTYNNVGGAIGAIDGDLSTLSTAVGGGGIKYFHANSPGGADSQAIGTDSVAIGSGAIANNPGDIALGQGSTTAAAVATTGTTIAGTAYTFAGTTPTSTLSVGALGAERTITNVAAGQLTATSTDAVNGSELYATNQAVTAVGKSTNQLGASTADALGGGATYDPATGKLVAPTYNVGATAYNNVGGAVGALQTGAPLQYSTAAAPTTGNGYVASQDATLVGAASGPVVLHNVGAGVAASDAANVGQLPGAFTAAHSNTFAFAQNGSGGPR